MKSASAVQQRSRNWCFTLNNWRLGDEQFLKDMGFAYVCWGQEIGKQGTPHLQGFFHLKDANTMNALKAMMGPSYHFEILKGKLEEAIDYSKKEATVWVEHGVRPIDPKENGLDRWAVALQQAREDGEVEDAQIARRHSRTVEFLHHQAMAKRQLVDTEDKHLWYWGAKGTGKNCKARTDYPNAYLKACNKWWNGFTNQEVVLIEDFDKSHGVLVHHLKIWADRYPFPCESRGSMMNIRPRLIVVTSNYSISDIWKDEKIAGPLRRRFKEVEFKMLGEYDN